MIVATASMMRLMVNDDLNVKYPPWAYVFGHLVPSGWRCFGRLRTFQDVGFRWRKAKGLETGSASISLSGLQRCEPATSQSLHPGSLLLLPPLQVQPHSCLQVFPS